MRSRGLPSVFERSACQRRQVLAAREGLSETGGCRETLKSGQTSRLVDGTEDALMRNLNGDPLLAVVAPLGVEQAVYVPMWRTDTWCAVLSLTRDGARLWTGAAVRAGR